MGCLVSFQNSKERPVTPPNRVSPTQVQQDTKSPRPKPEKTPGKTQIYVVYYSMYGHIRTMATAIKEGAEKVSDVQVTIFQIPETLPEEVLKKMHAPPKSDDPLITAADLTEADGVLFGIPSRYGSAATQVKAFMDTTGGLWMKQALAGKPGGIFFSTGGVGGGQETTAFTFLTHFAHHGMLYVPLGYADKGLMDVSEVHGGSPYGAGCLAGDGSRQPSALEIAIAHTQGEKFATIAKQIRLGHEAAEK